MSHNSIPPQPAENLLAFFAGPDLEDEICGDLFERYRQGRSRLWYWLEVFRALPALSLMHMQNLSRREYATEIGFAIFGLFFIWMWELNIARKTSWPLAQYILDYSPLSASNSCKAIYVLLYGGAVITGILVVKLWARQHQRSSHFKRVHILLFGLLASTLSIYLFINPGPHDGNRGFRIYQTLLVWAVTAFLFLDLRPIKIARRIT